MLTYDGGFDALTWTWSFADPDHWDVENSADGSTGWSVAGNEPGFARNSSLQIDGEFSRIIGRDGSGTAVTDYSNVVNNV